MVVDASVVLKLVIQESDSDHARLLVAREMLAAPDLLLVECANSLCVKSRRKQISVSDAAGAFAAIEAMPIRILPMRRHVAAAQAIAFELDQTVYDCIYLAAAVAERAILVTADKTLVQAAVTKPGYQAHIKLLTA